jgi:DNA-binding MarR family transcriptional regulator
MATTPQLHFDPIAEARRQWTAHEWSDEAQGMAIVTSIMRVHQLLLTRVDAVLRPFGLSFARYEVLMLLSFSRTGALPLGKISARLQVQAGAVTNAINRLERQGLVRRRPHPTDRRATLAVITRRGRSVARQATVPLNEHVFSAMYLAPEEAEGLFGLLRKIRIAAGDFQDDQHDPITLVT